ncbi:MAG: hypothetical protein ABIL58_12895 [Pseudomonadota bacterium]
MNVLQIALAIAVSMLMFATLATMVVEIIHKVLGMRRIGLKKMLQAFYTGEVKQRIQVMLKREKAASEDMPEFIDKITLKGSDSNVTTLEFIRRLADTEIGKGISQRVDTEVDALIEEIAVRYEEYGRQASVWFRKYSQIGTVLVSVLVALCLNINGVIIFKAFLQNETLARKVALQAEQAMTSYQIQAKSLAATIDKNDADTTDVDADMKSLKESVDRLKTSVADTIEMGLPIGWPFTWYNGNVSTIDKSKKNAEKTTEKTMDAPDWFVWVITTILTGLLIGLGGPFWYDVVKRLTPINQVAGALVRQPSSTDDPEKEGESPRGGGIGAAEDPKSAFKSVIRTNRILDGTCAEPDAFLGPKALRL